MLTENNAQHVYAIDGQIIQYYIEKVNDNNSNMDKHKTPDLQLLIDQIIVACNNVAFVLLPTSKTKYQEYR